jgi:hypothetical protein
LSEITVIALPDIGPGGSSTNNVKIKSYVDPSKGVLPLTLLQYDYQIKESPHMRLQQTATRCNTAYTPVVLSHTVGESPYLSSAAYSEKALYTNLDICAGEVFVDYDNRDNTLRDVTFNLKVTNRYHAE